VTPFAVSEGTHPFIFVKGTHPFIFGTLRANPI
jgi:hypothetical protein